MNWLLNVGFITPDEVQNEIDDFSKERENTLNPFQLYEKSQT